jgi:hypothetical protein
MSRILLSVLTLAVLLGAENPWDKVRQLKSGTDLRIYKTGAVKPLDAKMDEATADHLGVVIKNRQVSIARDQIDRIDSRAPAGKAVTTREDKSAIKMASPDPTQPWQGSPGITQSTSSTVSRSRTTTGFETVYRRPPAK